MCKFDFILGDFVPFFIILLAGRLTLVHKTTRGIHSTNKNNGVQVVVFMHPKHLLRLVMIYG